MSRKSRSDTGPRDLVKARKAVAMYQAGELGSTICKNLGCGINSLYVWLRYFNVPTRRSKSDHPDWYPLAQELRERKYTLQEIADYVGKSRQRVHKVLDGNPESSDTVSQPVS